MSVEEIMKKPAPTVEEIHQALRSIMVCIGEDPDREGLLDTPDRIMRSWKELYSGYQQSPEQILSKRFTETDGYDQLVLLKNIGFFSMCEHHNLSFMGVAHVGYFPGDCVIGISKLARLVDCHAHRMQIQERLTKSVADDIMTYLKPRGVAVVVEGQHLCMQARGVKKIGSTMVTSAMEGIFKDNSGGCKDEFLTLVGMNTVY
jgi:GTP cyclohydrolase IA